MDALCLPRCESWRLRSNNDTALIYTIHTVFCGAGIIQYVALQHGPTLLGVIAAHSCRDRYATIPCDSCTVISFARLAATVQM